MKKLVLVGLLFIISCGKKQLPARLLSEDEKAYLPYTLGQKLVFKNLSNSSLKIFYVNYKEDEIIQAETSNDNIVLNGYSRSVKYSKSVFRLNITDSVYYGGNVQMEPGYTYKDYSQRTFLHGSFNKFTFENVILDDFAIHNFSVNGTTYQNVLKIDSTVFSYKYQTTKTLYIAQGKGIVRWDDKNGEIYELQ